MSTAGVDLSPSAAHARPVRAPRWPVLGATGLLGVSAVVLVLVVLGDQTSMLATSLGYATGAVGVSILVVVHRLRTQQVDHSPQYQPSGPLAAAARVLLLLGLAVGLGNAYFLATEIAKR
jgi:uncharacterized membrane protein YuzA (DUF378 family)